MHITRKHSDEERVKNALALPKRERIEMFTVFRNEGILKTNLKEIGKEEPKLERKRRENRGKDLQEESEDEPKDNEDESKGKKRKKKNERLKMCNGCKIFINSESLARHRRVCVGSKKSFGIDVSLLKKPTFELSEEFKMC